MKYDVVIVGAGPAGSTAAKFLSEKGIRVLLVDKSKFPRDKACGGGIPVRVFKDFEYLKNSNFIESYSCGGYVYSPSGKYSAAVLRDQPYIAMVLRKKLDAALVGFAQDKGATFIEGVAVENIEIDDDKVNIFLENGKHIESSIVIGADGVWSGVSVKSGLNKKMTKYGISVYQEYAVDSDVLDRYFSTYRYFHLHFYFHGLDGYGWIFPKKHHVNIGVVEMRKKSKSTENSSLKDMFREYMHHLQKNDIIPKNLTVGKLKGAVLPNCPAEKTYGDRIILCGDAGGLIHPFNGEGIEYAMISGRIAAEVIAESLEKGDTSARFLSRYEKRWKKEFGKTIRLFLRVQKRGEKIVEKVIKVISKDKIMTEIALDIGAGNSTVHEQKWTIMKHLLFQRFRNIFHRK